MNNKIVKNSKMNSDKETLIKDLVSIIIPSYNRYPLLINCINSCLCQTYKEIEIIVVDDCSTDPRYKNGSLELFPKTKVLHLPINQRLKYKTKAAQGMTRQEGINIASGEWIAFLDDDDFYLPDKIEKQLRLMKEREMLFSSTNMYMVTHKSYSVDKLDIKVERLYLQQDLPEIFDIRLIARTNFINNSSVLIHRSLIDKVGRFKAEKYEDWQYWKRVLIHTNCLYIKEPLVYYTIGIKKNYIY